MKIQIQRVIWNLLASAQTCLTASGNDPEEKLVSDEKIGFFEFLGKKLH